MKSKWLGIVSTLISNAAIVLGILGSALLLAGFSLNFGYLSAYGLSADTLVTEFSENFVSAFYVGVLTISNLMGFLKLVPWILLGFLLFVSVVVFVIHYIKCDKKRMDKLFAWEESNGKVFGLSPRLRETIDHIWPDVSRVWNLCIFSVFILLIAALIVVKPFHWGKEHAELEISNFKKVGFDCRKTSKTPINCYRLIDSVTQEVLAEGIYLTGNRRQIVLFDGSEIEIYPRKENYLLSVSPRF